MCVYEHGPSTKKVGSTLLQYSSNIMLTLNTLIITLIIKGVIVYRQLENQPFSDIPSGSMHLSV